MPNAYTRSKAYSDNKLSSLREALKSIVPDDCVVLTCGSYARREASDKSDIDFFILTPYAPPRNPLPWMTEARDAIGGIVKFKPSKNGAFGQPEARKSVSINIGGDKDSNKKMTRRMLYLLEGEWLTNADLFYETRRKILDRYVTDRIRQEHITFFLLNDIVRYYRTIATDYEYKTVEQANPKEWGIRNIKLVFARKLLYASGIFAAGATYNRPHLGKIEELERLFKLTPIERLKDLCGASADSALESYYFYLERIERAEVRETLKAIKQTERNNIVYRELKDQGHTLTDRLIKLFRETYPENHPMRTAVLF
jgi:hypothetical protein